MPSAANVNLVTCGKWHLTHTAKAFAKKDRLAGFYLSDNDRTDLPRKRIHRCWVYHLAMKPFYHLAPQILIERAGFSFHGLWRSWIRLQNLCDGNVVQATMGNATEAFTQVDGLKHVLKVVDAPNSHPKSYAGRWQKECDRWCPGEKIPVPDWMLLRMEKELIHADVILCPSLFVRESMIGHGIDAEKCFINPFGVDLQLFKPRLAVPDSPKFVSVGTICLRKGFQYLFRAFEMVKRRLPQAELIVVGDYKIDFRMERERWQGSFTQIKHVDHVSLGKLLRSCTAFVFPSIEEGFARVIPEAMATALPIIATHESGATTLVRSGVEGLIVPSKDPKQLAEAMVQLGMDPLLNLKMGRAAWEAGTSRNTWQDYGDRLVVEYDRRLSATTVRQFRL